MKKGISTLIITAFTLIFLSGCFSINDSITIGPNGSGSVVTTVDMREMMKLLGMFLPDSLKEQMQFKNIIGGDHNRYSNIEGISNIKVESSQEYLYTVSFDFANSTALNKALSLKAEGMSPGLMEMLQTQYKIGKHKMERNTTINTASIAELKQYNGSETRELFGRMNSPTYTITYHLPSKLKKISVKGNGAEVSKKEKEVSISYKLFDFLEANTETMKHCLKY